MLCQSLVVVFFLKGTCKLLLIIMLIKMELRKIRYSLKNNAVLLVTAQRAESPLTAEISIEAQAAWPGC